MTDEPPKESKKMPKGGRKGGAMFPRHVLSECLVWSKKLVSKTHLAPQPVEIIFAGVVGAKGGHGNVRVSALKQYGLMEGSSSSYIASMLAKNIDAAPLDELPPMYAKAALGPSLFKALFDTFHGDGVTKAKLKQRAAELHVHPEETENCIEIYTSSLVTAGLVKIDGEKIVHVKATEISSLNSNEDTSILFEKEDDAKIYEKNDGNSTSDSDADEIRGDTAKSPRAAFNVNIMLDSSLDIEKLEKQLKLLKRFGAI